MVRAGGVVARALGAPGADEDAAGRRDFRGDFRRVLQGDDQVLRGILLGEVDDLPEGRENDGETVRQGSIDLRIARKRFLLNVNLLQYLIGIIPFGADEDGGAVLSVLRLGEEVGCGEGSL